MGTVSLQKGCLPKLTPLTSSSSLLTALCCSVGTAAKENMKDALKKLPTGETHTHTHAHRCYGGKLSSLLFAIGYPSGPFQPLVKMKRLFIKLVFSDIPSVELRAVTAISFISCDESNICGGRRRSQELTQSPAASSAAHTTGAP